MDLVLPEYDKKAFNCPSCGAYAMQEWKEICTAQGICDRNGTHGADYIPENVLKLAQCSCCDEYSIWHEKKLVYPDKQVVEPPNEDLPGDIKEDYLEAASILNKSTRGASALLRLCIQKLCIALGEKGESINTDIGRLVKKGLPEKVQEALDSVRVVGNEAVHPGELDIKDDVETAKKLFKIINFIADRMITDPKEIDEFYNNALPQKKKDQIKERDKK